MAPKIFYHGSGTVFKMLDKKFDSRGLVFYFTNAETAQKYGQKQYKVFLKAKKIFECENLEHLKKLKKYKLNPL